MEHGQEQGSVTVQSAGTGTEMEMEPNRGGEATVEAGITPAGTAAEMEKVRELVLQANPDVVPELVRGNSVDELIAAVEPARGAYQRIAERVRAGQAVAAQPAGTEPAVTVTQPAATETVGVAQTAATGTAGVTQPAATEAARVTQPPVVPAGGAQNAIDPAAIPPTEKIARALEARRG